MLATKISIRNNAMQKLLDYGLFHILENWYELKLNELSNPYFGKISFEDDYYACLGHTTKTMELFCTLKRWIIG